MKNFKIPEEDLKIINAAFASRDSVQTIEKNVGGKIVKAHVHPVKGSSVVFKNFSGRVLRHQKSIVVPGQGQVVVCVRGDKYDDIPIEKKNLVVWTDDDFET